jgi:predicted NAD-dependent protein-ADP-ribosyltransferase YbiA (DUF1768 family)
VYVHTYKLVVGVCGHKGATRLTVCSAGGARCVLHVDTTSTRNGKNRHVTVWVVAVQTPERLNLEHMPERSECVGVHVPRPPTLLSKELCLQAHAKYHPTSEFVLVDGVRTRCVSDSTIEDYINVGQLARWPFSILSHYATSEPFKVDGVEGMSAMKWSSTNAAYECIARLAPEHWHKLQHRYGCFSRMLQGAHLVSSASKAIDRLVCQYGQNLDLGKHGMDGYMSRLAVKRVEDGRVLKAELKLREKQDRMSGFQEKFDTLVMLTAARMRADERARSVLLSTGDKMLVELNRFAEADVNKGFPERAVWGGYVSATNKRLYGCNLMGEVLMEVRCVMKKEAEAGCFDNIWFPVRRGLISIQAMQNNKRKRENSAAFIVPCAHAAPRLDRDTAAIPTPPARPPPVLPPPVLPPPVLPPPVPPSTRGDTMLHVLCEVPSASK